MTSAAPSMTARRAMTGAWSFRHGAQRSHFVIESIAWRRLQPRLDEARGAVARDALVPVGRQPVHHVGVGIDQLGHDAEVVVIHHRVDPLAKRLQLRAIAGKRMCLLDGMKMVGKLLRMIKHGS